HTWLAGVKMSGHELSMTFAGQSVKPLARLARPPRLGAPAYGIVLRFVIINTFRRTIIMARKCQVTGKKPMSGNNVSHANNRTKRRFEPNLQWHRFWIPSEGRWVRLRVTPRGIKTIDKLGIEKVLSDMRARGEKI